MATGCAFDAWYGFDTENDPSGKVTLAALVGEDGSRKIWTKAGHLAGWCERQTGNPIVICHNLEYDLVNEFGDDYAWLGLNYLKGRLISAKLGNVTFRDSLNHFKMRLSELGESFGIEKLKMDINDPEYVTQDATICLRSMCFARDYIARLGGRQGATSGSSALSIWRHITEDEFLFGPIDNAFYRSGYYGGRVELFRKRSEGKIVGFDINSMYPYSMLNDYPETLMDDPRMTKFKGMAEVTITIPRDRLVAPLPYRTPANKQLIYPVGTIRGTWTYDEIRYAESLGSKVQKVHKACGGSSLCRPFDDYVLPLYQARKESKNPAERLMLKIMLNSLYGKIAAKSTVTRTVSRHTLMQNNPARVEDVKWINEHRGLLDYCSPPQPHINVMWGSMITAYSRLTLLKWLDMVPPEKLIYCDTDSIYTLDHELPVSDGLGQLKREKEARIMVCHQPKTYQQDNQFVAKGVPRAVADDDGVILVDPARDYIEKEFASFQAPLRFRASLTSKRGVANQWLTMTKSMKTDYTHKTYSNGRYFPKLIEEQYELPLT